MPNTINTEFIKNHYVLFKERAHSGFDITADINTEVYSIEDGVVLLAEYEGITLKALTNGMMIINKVKILNDDGHRVVCGYLREF